MISKLRPISLWLALLILTGCGPSVPPSISVAPKQVSTMTVTETPGYEQSSNYTGRVEATLDSRVGFELGGLIAEVLVDEGDRVERGDPLARLDAARLHARRAEVDAELRQVKADLTLAQATFKRTEQAFSFKGVSEQELEEVATRVRALAARRQVTRARRNSIDVDLEKTELKAPFDGVVTGRYADPGEVLAAGQQLLRLQSDVPPEIRIGVAPTAAMGLRVGRDYSLSINGRSLFATLKTLIPRRDTNTRTMDALFTLTQTDPAVRPGDLAILETRIWINERGFWMPLSALTEGPRGLWQGLVAQADTAAESSHYTLIRRTVEVLYVEGERAFVRGTLSEGDRVVRRGLHRVVAGQRVTLDPVSDSPDLAHRSAEPRS